MLGLRYQAQNACLRYKTSEVADLLPVSDSDEADCLGLLSVSLLNISERTVSQSQTVADWLSQKASRWLTMSDWPTAPE
jgi:hypothetical protein